MVKSLTEWADRIILVGFHLLFFLVPLLLTPINYELFEYTKMMTTYAFTVIIVSAWAIKMIANTANQTDKSHRDRLFRKTPFDIPLLLFLASQIISTLISLDPHVSIWGYYSRFNGGLLSTITYVLLYYAFVSNISASHIRRLLWTIFTSATLVSVYGITEHFGIDKTIWVQDVQNRVFSTLGQPNWLAAYLVVLIPIAIAYLEEKKWLGSIVGLLFFATLLCTKSRSGLLGLAVALIVYLALSVRKHRSFPIKTAGLFTGSIILITFLFGTPLPSINRFLLPGLLSGPPPSSKVTSPTPAPATTDILDVGVTESGDIRKIVWSGAIDITKHYPFFGSGVETFAFSYYQFRPAAHNMTSEWDFLYNKAHNEFLNMAATTGLVGLGTYLLFIGWFIWWNIRSVHKNIKSASDALPIALFCGWLSIHVTNFFGFSVVIIQLFFFLIPAMAFILSSDITVSSPSTLRISTGRKLMMSVVVLFAFYLLWNLMTMWYADTDYASGYHNGRGGDLAQSYSDLHAALNLNPREPMYYDELALTASQLAVALTDENQSTMAAQLTKEAIAASDLALTISPKNVNFWKTRTRMFYAFAQLDPKYLPDTLTSIQQAKSLSPTDPKIRYNLALVYNALDKKDEAYKELTAAETLKPNYKEPFFAMALFYERDKQIDKAKAQLQYILTRIDANDAEVKKKLKELQ